MSVHGWKLLPYKGASFGLSYNSRPCWFHRLMQRLAFGFYWEKVE